MGNSDLKDIFVQNKIDIDNISDSRVAVDAPNWIYSYITITTRFTDTEVYTSDGKKLPNLIGVPKGLQKFFEYNLKPVFVFDGTTHNSKREEVERRKQTRKKAEKKAQKAREEGDIIKASRYESQSQWLTPQMIHTTKELLDILDIEYMTAPSAAEAQTAYMNSNDSFEYAISDDYDSILFGAENTVRNFTSSSKQTQNLSLKNTMEKHKISRGTLIDIAILCGTDYNDGVHGIGPKTALSLCSNNYSINEILDEKDAAIPNFEEIKNLFMEPPVSEEYTIPSNPNPNIDEAKEYICNNWDIPNESIEKSLETIKSESKQVGLGDF